MLGKRDILKRRQVERYLVANGEFAPGMQRAESADALVRVPTQDLAHFGFVRRAIAKRAPALIAAEVGERASLAELMLLLHVLPRAYGKASGAPTR
ncbi:MAG TPA: hypothetical protein VFC18_20080 [Burkholderiales bacterium]|nr:hypothetical protein [Burkholderiales bacterium]